MHEYSIASELISGLLPQVEALDGAITHVRLKKGALRILSDDAMRSAFAILAEGTPLEGAQLVIETVPVCVRCTACGYRGAPDRVDEETFHYDIPILSCPSCGGRVDVETGRELLADQVTVETREADDG